MKRIRPNTFVEEGNLTQNISLLRKALGESPGGVQFIETVPRRGYRFVADTSQVWHEEPVESSVENSQPPAEPVVSIPNTTSDPPGIKRTPVYALAAGIAVASLIGLFYYTGLGNAGNPLPIQSIAVLPFVDESSDPDAQYIN